MRTFPRLFRIFRIHRICVICEICGTRPFSCLFRNFRINRICVICEICGTRTFPRLFRIHRICGTRFSMKIQVAVLNPHQSSLSVEVRNLQPVHPLAVGPRTQTAPSRHSPVNLPLIKKKSAGSLVQPRMFEESRISCRIKRVGCSRRRSRRRNGRCSRWSRS